MKNKKNSRKIIIAIIAIIAFLAAGLYLNANKNPENALMGAVKTKKTITLTVQGSVIDSITNNKIKDHNEPVTCTAITNFTSDNSKQSFGTGQLAQDGTFQSIISQITPKTATQIKCEVCLKGYPCAAQTKTYGGGFSQSQTIIAFNISAINQQLVTLTIGGKVIDSNSQKNVNKAGETVTCDAYFDNNTYEGSTGDGVLLSDGTYKGISLKGVPINQSLKITCKVKPAGYREGTETKSYSINYFTSSSSVAIKNFDIKVAPSSVILSISGNVKINGTNNNVTTEGKDSINCKAYAASDTAKITPIGTEQGTLAANGTFSSINIGSIPDNTALQIDCIVTPKGYQQGTGTKSISTTTKDVKITDFLIKVTPSPVTLSVIGYIVDAQDNKLDLLYGTVKCEYSNPYELKTADLDQDGTFPEITYTFQPINTPSTLSCWVTPDSQSGYTSYYSPTQKIEFPNGITTSTQEFIIFKLVPKDHIYVSVWGKVLDNNNKPIIESQVTVICNSFNATVNYEGKYSINNILIPAGGSTDVICTANANGYSSSFQSFSFEGKPSTNGKTAEANFKLTPKDIVVNITGVVKNTNGNALSKATVTCNKKTSSPGLDGKYSIKNIPVTGGEESFQVTCTASAPNYITSAPKILYFNGIPQNNNTSKTADFINLIPVGNPSTLSLSGNVYCYKGGDITTILANIDCEDVIDSNVSTTSYSNQQNKYYYKIKVYFNNSNNKNSISCKITPSSSFPGCSSNIQEVNKGSTSSNTKTVDLYGVFAEY